MGRKKVNNIEEPQLKRKRGRPRKDESITKRVVNRYNVSKGMYIWSMDQILHLKPGKLITSGKFQEEVEKQFTHKEKQYLPHFFYKSGKYIYTKTVIEYLQKPVLVVKVMVDTDVQSIELNVVNSNDKTYAPYWNRGWGDNEIVKEIDIEISKVLNYLTQMKIIRAPRGWKEEWYEDQRTKNN